MALKTLTTGWLAVADTTYPNAVKYKIDIVEQSISIEENTSLISAVRVYMKTVDSAIKPNMRWRWQLTLNGDISLSNGIPSAGQQLTTDGVLICSFTAGYTIPHNANGAKSLSLRRAMQSYDSNSNLRYNVPTVTSSYALTTIARASTPSVSGSVVMGDTVTIYTNRAATSFTHTLSYSFGGASETITMGVEVSTPWTIPLSLASQIPAATSGTLTLTCVTYNGSTVIGTKAITLTLSVPAYIVPTVSAYYEDYVIAIRNKFGVLVQGHSRLEVLVNAAGIQGSTINTMTIVANGETITDSDFVSGETYITAPLGIAGDQTAVVTVTDTRGRSASAFLDFTVEAYSPPAITAFNLDRCVANGAVDSEGECLLMDLTLSVTPLGGYNAPTTINVTYTQADTEDPPTSIYTRALTSVFAFITTDTVLGTYTNGHGIILADYAYVLTVTVTDQLGMSSVTRLVERAAPVLDILADGTGIAFGTVAQHSDVAEFGMKILRSGGLMPLWSSVTGTLSGNDITGLSDLFRYFTVFMVLNTDSSGVNEGAAMLATKALNAAGDMTILGAGGYYDMLAQRVVQYAMVAQYDEGADRLTGMQILDSAGNPRKIIGLYGIA